MPKAAAHDTQPTPELEELGPQPDPSSWEFAKQQVHVIEPGNSLRLAILIQTMPQYQDQILAEAQIALGNATVQAALAQLGVHMQGPAPEQDQAALDAVKQESSGPADQPGSQAVLDQYQDQVMNAPAPTVVDQYKDDINAAQAPDVAPVANLQKAPDPNSWEDTVRFQVLAATTAEELAVVLKGFPQFRQQILETSQLADVEKERAVQMADAPTQDATEEQAPPPPAAEGPQPGDTPTTADPTSEADLEKEPAWIGRARAYNLDDDHIGNSSQFNALTEGQFSQSGQLDPVLIAAWQQQNGLEPDGRVGEHTLAKAQELLKKPQLQAPAPEDLIPEDELRNEVE
jgi:hypothetical protein